MANDPTRPAGWFYQLPNAGERVIIDAVDTDIGKIAWLGSIPTPDNPCDPQQSSRIYVANFETGQSQLYDPVALQSGNLVRITSYDPQAGIVGLRLARVSGNIRAVLTGQSGELRLSQELFRYLNPRTMNWREVTDPGL